MSSESEKVVEEVVPEEEDSWIVEKLSTVTDNLDTYLGRDAM